MSRFIQKWTVKKTQRELVDAFKAYNIDICSGDQKQNEAESAAVTSQGLKEEDFPTYSMSKLSRSQRAVIENMLRSLDGELADNDDLLDRYIYELSGFKKKDTSDWADYEDNALS